MYSCTYEVRFGNGSSKKNLTGTEEFRYHDKLPENQANQALREQIKKNEKVSKKDIEDGAQIILANYEERIEATPEYEATLRKMYAETKEYYDFHQNLVNKGENKSRESAQNFLRILKQYEEKFREVGLTP